MPWQSGWGILILPWPVRGDEGYLDTNVVALPHTNGKEVMTYGGSEVALLVHRRGLLDSPGALADLGPRFKALAETWQLKRGQMPAGRFPDVVESTAYLLVARTTASGPATVSAAAESGVLVVTVRTKTPDVPAIGRRLGVSTWPKRVEAA